MVSLGAWLRRRKAMLGELGFHVHLSRQQVATALWDYGEDALVDTALTMTDKQLASIEKIAATYEDPNHRLPMDGRITHNHVNAFAAITYFEGELRPLSRTRRRPQKNRPEPLLQ